VLGNTQSRLVIVTVLSLTCALQVFPQTIYPKEIRGYKVQRAVIELKKSESANAAKSVTDPNTLLSLGEPELARLTPLGITFDIPIIVSPVQQKGHVEFLVFEDLVVNNTPVEISDYQHGFDLPNKDKLILPDPLKIYIYLPSAVIAAIDEWSNSKDTWQVTGRVYVFGKFKKSIFTAKRCIPVDLNLTIRNPLRAQ
jgi:hypothetical protein